MTNAETVFRDAYPSGVVDAWDRPTFGVHAGSLKQAHKRVRQMRELMDAATKQVGHWTADLVDTVRMGWGHVYHFLFKFVEPKTEDIK